MQTIGDMKFNVAIDSAVSRMPMRIIPGNLVRTEFIQFLWNGRMNQRLELRIYLLSICSGLAHGPAVPRRLNEIQVFHEPVVAHHSEHIGLSGEAQMRREVETERNEARF